MSCSISFAPSMRASLLEVVPHARLSRSAVDQRRRITVRPDTAAGVVKVISVIDNLVKGASGQAVQNMNIMFGLEETTGLRGRA